MSDSDGQLALAALLCVVVGGAGSDRHHKTYQLPTG